MPLGMSYGKYFILIGGGIVSALVGGSLVNRMYRPNLKLNLEPELIEMKREIEKFKRESSIKTILERIKKD